MKKIVRNVVIFVIIITMVLGSIMLYLMRGMKEILNEEISSISFTDIDNGTYIGTYEKYRWISEIEVTVLNGQVVSINIIKDHQITNDLTSVLLFQQVLEANSLDVDMISGATVSSIAYLKAIEDAIKE